MSAPVTAGADPALTLARAQAAQLREVAALLDAIAEGSDIALAGGVASLPVAHFLIGALRLTARAARGEPVTP